MISKKFNVSGWGERVAECGSVYCLEGSAGLVIRLTFVLSCTCFVVVLVFLKGQFNFPIL